MLSVIGPQQLGTISQRRRKLAIDVERHLYMHAAQTTYLDV
jgi:hypothetical protein